MQNTFTIDVDIKKTSYFNEPTVTSNDDITFVVNISDDGQVFDLADVTTVSLANTKPDNEVVVTPGVISGTNQVTFVLGTNETSVSGRVNAVIQLYDASGRVSTLSFSYAVKVDPTGSGYVPSTDEQTLIEVVLNDGPLRIQEAIDAGVYANLQGDYAKSSGDTAITNWLLPVANFVAIGTTYATPSLGDTVQSLDNGYVYRFDGIGWVYTQGYSATAIADVNNDITILGTDVSSLDVRVTGNTAQLADISYNISSFSGVSDDEKIVNAFNFMNNLTAEGATLFFPRRITQYVLTSSVVSNGKWNLKMDKEIKYNGTGTAITIKGAIRRSIEIMIFKGSDYAGWFTDTDLTSIGVEFDNVNFCEIKLRDIRGFYNNVLFDNDLDKGCAYNNIFIGLIYDSFINIYLKQNFDIVTTGWVNQNQIYGGAIKNSGGFRPVKPGTTLIKNEGNNNTIIGTSLEGDTFQHSIFTSSSDNCYINCRYEQNLDNSLAFDGTSCKFNTIIGGYGLSERILNITNPSNVTIMGSGRISGLYNSNTYPEPILEGYTAGSSINELLRLGKINADGVTKRKTIVANGDGELSFYHNVEGDFPQLEIHGRYGQLLFGSGLSPTVMGFMVDATPAANLIRFENWNYEFRDNSSLSFSPKLLVNGTTSIDLSKANVFKTANTAPVSITAHTGGRDGKPIYLFAEDTFTTLVHGSSIKLKGAVSRLLVDGEVVHFLRINGIIVEV